MAIAPLVCVLLMLTMKGESQLFSSNFPFGNNQNPFEEINRAMALQRRMMQSQMSTMQKQIQAMSAKMTKDFQSMGRDMARMNPNLGVCEDFNYEQKQVNIKNYKKAIITKFLKFYKLKLGKVIADGPCTFVTYYKNLDNNANCVQRESMKQCGSFYFLNSCTYTASCQTP